MHLQLIERGVRHVVEGGGRWAVMLGRLLRMLGRKNSSYDRARPAEFVVGDALRHTGMLVGVLGAWRSLRSCHETMCGMYPPVLGAAGGSAVQHSPLTNLRAALFALPQARP